jgi:hypothetical protein
MLVVGIMGLSSDPSGIDTVDSFPHEAEFALGAENSPRLSRSIDSFSILGSNLLEPSADPTFHSGSYYRELPNGNKSSLPS